MCALTTLMTHYLATPRRRTRTRLPTPRSTRRRVRAEGRGDGPSVAGPSPVRDAEPLKVTK
jgi:hypothetical protein